MFMSEPANHPGDHRGSALPRPGRRAPSAGLEETSRMPPPAPRLGEDNPPDGGPPPVRKAPPANVHSLPQPSRISGTRFAPTPRNRPTTTSLLDTSIEPQPHAVPPTPAVMDVSLSDPLSETQPMDHTSPVGYRPSQSTFTVPPPMPPVHSDATQTSGPYVARPPHHPQHTSVPSYRIGSQRTASPGRIVPPIASSSTSAHSQYHTTTRRQPRYDVAPRSPRPVIGGGDGTAVGQIRRSRSPHINAVPSVAPPEDRRCQTTPPATSLLSVRPPFPGWDAPVDPNIHHVVHQPQSTKVALVQETYDDVDYDAPSYGDDYADQHNNDNYGHQPIYNNSNQKRAFNNVNGRGHRSEPIFVNPIDERFSVQSSSNMGGGGRGALNNHSNEPFGEEDAKSPSVSVIKYSPYHQPHTLAGGGRGPGGPGGSSATPVSPSATRQLHFPSQSPLMSSAVGASNNRGGSADSSRHPYSNGGGPPSTTHPIVSAEATTSNHPCTVEQNRRPLHASTVAPHSSVQPGAGLKRVPSGGVRTYKVPSRRPSNATNNAAGNPRQLNGFTLHTNQDNRSSSNNIAPRHVDSSAARPAVAASVVENPTNSLGASVASRRSHSSIASARSKSFSPTHRSASLASLHRFSNGKKNDDGEGNLNEDAESSASSSLSDVDRPHVHTRWAPSAEEILLSICESASEDDDVPTLTVLGREASPQYKASPQVLGMNVSRSQSVGSMSPRMRSRAGSVTSQGGIGSGSPHHHHVGYYMPKEEPPGMRQRTVPTYVDPALRETFMKAIGGSTATSALGVGTGGVARFTGKGRGPGGATPRDESYKWKDGINTSRISPERSSAPPVPSLPPPPPPPPPQELVVPKRETTPDPASPPHIKPIEPIVTQQSEPVAEVVAPPEPEITHEDDAAAVTAPPSPAKATSPLPYYGRNDSPVDPMDLPQTVTFGKVQVREVYPYLINGMTEKQYKQLMLTNMNAMNESKAPKVKQRCCS